MKIGHFFKLVFVTLLIAFFVFVFLFVFVTMVDVFTMKEIGEQSVPCLDERNRPFENEMCTKKVHCSWLGFAASERCVNVLEGEA